jgi:hypothetical protein
MKRIFLSAGIMMAATSIFAQDVAHVSRKEVKMENKEARKDLRAESRLENKYEVSVLTKDQFTLDFPDAKDVLFERTAYFDEVSFKSGNENLRAYYDNSSKLIGTTEKKSFTDLPVNAQKKIKKEYAGYDAVDVIKFDDNEGNDMDMILYGTTFNDADNYFVELSKDNKTIVVEVSLLGAVSYFKAIR